MHPTEINDALRGMVIIVDTREQDTVQLHNRLKHFGRYERAKLDSGDYGAKFPLPGGGWLQIPVVVERKMSLDELAACFCRDRPRFKSEFDRAAAAKIKIYLLIEGESWEAAYSGDYRSKMAPKAMVASLLSWLSRYDCQLIFCEKRTTGKLIHDILYREGKEALKRLIDDG